MELGWLEDFLALRELESFTAAADRRNISQSAFSRRIQSLEDWLGVTLIDRSVRPHRFTPVAAENYGDFQRILNQLYELRSQVRGEQSRASRLRVAIQHSLAFSIFPRFVETLRQQGYQPAYQLSCANRSDCMEMMMRGEVDVMICYEMHPSPEPIIPTTAVRVASARDDMILVGPPALIPEKQQVLPLLTYPQRSFFGEVIWEKAMPQLMEYYRCEIICLSSLSGALREMMLAGLGFAWLPRSLVLSDLAQGRVVQLDPETMFQPLRVAIYCCPQDSSGLTATALSHLQSVNLQALIEQQPECL
ncbi:DNA-binding transcriptional LysR family regulator [Phyllobacterium myrsinacearum]|nr:DNA-binding transcriptional LysR family regulator [Phyllobacterium myrsinacearum]